MGDVCPAHQLILQIEDFRSQDRQSTILHQLQIHISPKYICEMHSKFSMPAKKLVVKGVKNTFNLGLNIQLDSNRYFLADLLDNSVWYLGLPN